MFRIGDAVVHSTLGLCKVVEIKKDKGKRTYILKPQKPLPGGFKILIQEDKVKLSGIRYPMSRKEVDHIFRILNNDPIDISENGQKVYSGTESKIKSGNPKKMAQALRDLTKCYKSASSTSKEQLLDLARTLLIEEIAYVIRAPKSKVDELLNKALNK